MNLRINILQAKIQLKIIREKISELKRLINRLNNFKSEVNNAWKGPAATAFNNSIESWSIELKNSLRNMEELANTIDTVIEQLSENEKNLTEILGGIFSTGSEFNTGSGGGSGGSF